MNDDFIIISKDEHKNLKNSNSKDITKHTKDVKDTIEVLKDEFKKEQDFIKKELNNLKSLTKSTLNNVVSKDETMTKKTEEMLDVMKVIASSLNEVIHQIAVEEQSLGLSKEFEKEDSTASKDVMDKLTSIEGKMIEVETFLDKLKILLSQVKPTDLNYDSSNNYPGKLPPQAPNFDLPPQAPPETPPTPPPKKDDKK